MTTSLTPAPQPNEELSEGSLGFYDRLRNRITAYAERRAGRPGRQATETLLLAPDLFVLLARLSLDRQVPRETRRVLVGALAYFVMPVDLMPEGLIGPGGFLDDVVLVSLVLSQAFAGDLEPWTARYWNGSEKLRVVIGDVSETATQLLGRNLYGRLRRLLGRRGIRLEDRGRRAAGAAPRRSP